MKFSLNFRLALTPETKAEGAAAFRLAEIRRPIPLFFCSFVLFSRRL
jgi:hypothetical protein